VRTGVFALSASSGVDNRAAPEYFLIVDTMISFSLCDSDSLPAYWAVVLVLFAYQRTDLNAQNI